MMGESGGIIVQFFGLCLWWGVCHAAITESLTILHTSEVMLHFEESGAPLNDCKQGADCFGGLARLTAELDAKNAERTNTLLVDTGNFIDPMLIGDASMKEIVTKLLKPLKYDVMTLGTADLGGGSSVDVDNLAEYVRIMDTTFVCTNIRFPNDTESGRFLNEKCLRSQVKMYGGLKIAVLSFMSNSYVFENITVADPVEALKREIKKLKTTYYIRAFVVLAHSEKHLDRQIMKHFNNTILITGHTRALYHNGPSPNGAHVDFPYPVNMTFGNHTVLVAGAGFNLVFLGHLRLNFTYEGDLLSYEKTNPVFLNGEKDAEVEKMLAKHRSYIMEISGGVLGKSVFVVDGSTRCHSRECGLGNFITDAMVHFGVQQAHAIDAKDRWTVFSVALVEVSTFGSSLLRGYITRLDVQSLLTFDDSVDAVSLLGIDLYNLIVEMLSDLRTIEDHQLDHADEGRFFMQFSGLKVTVTKDRTDSGYQVRTVHVLCKTCLTPHYEPLKFDEEYVVLVNSYLAQSKNLKDLGQVHVSLIQLITNYVNRMTPVITVTGARLMGLDSEAVESAAAPPCDLLAPLMLVPLLLVTLLDVVNRRI